MALGGEDGEDGELVLSVLDGVSCCLWKSFCSRSRGLFVDILIDRPLNIDRGGGDVAVQLDGSAAALWSNSRRA